MTKSNHKHFMYGVFSDSDVPVDSDNTAWIVSVYVRAPDHLLLLAARAAFTDQAAALTFAQPYMLRHLDPVFGYPITEIDFCSNSLSKLRLRAFWEMNDAD